MPRFLPRALFAFLSLASFAAFGAPVEAQQPLSEFVRAARTHAVDVREAKALAEQADWQTAEARGRILPSLTASGAFTRNEIEVAVQVPRNGMVTNAVISPLEQLDGRVALQVPLIDLGGWATLAQMGALEDAAEARLEGTQQSVEVAVTQLWHQLVATRALVRAATQNLEASESSLKNTKAREQVGSGTAGDTARAEAEVARATQSLEEARLQEKLTGKSLENVSGLRPSDAEAEIAPDLADEKPLPEFLRDLSAQPGMRAANADLSAAEALRTAAWMNFLPVLGATAAERYTNAAGFGPRDLWTLALTASWTLDFVKPATAGVRSNALESAEARYERARQSTEYAIYEAWHRVMATRARVKAAKTAADASALAARDMQDRLSVGAATQLEAIQADRDRFSAEVARIQAEAELAVARRVLRIRSGVESGEAK
jgi:outer membrane protein TolC